MAATQVKSEIGELKRVVLHRPGDELLNLTPETLEELLFDDIPFLKVAQEEHDAFAEILRKEEVDVVYLEDLMAETLDANDGLRDKFLAQFVSEAGINDEGDREQIIDWLNSNYKNNKDLVVKTMAGINVYEYKSKEDPTTSLKAAVDTENYLVIPPMPNLYFTRDPFAMIGHGVSVNHMYSVTRNRETIYGSYVFNYHPTYGSVPEFYDRNDNSHIEGGDILNINDKTLAIGISQRTQAAAIEKIAKRLFASEESTIETILAFRIAESRAFMHLDTVFTQIDVDKFTIHPAILGPLTVYEITKGVGDSIKVNECTEELETVLSRYCGTSVQLIKCGGDDMIAAAREQWNDGSNTLCVRPGTVVVYERNNVTNDLLDKKGINALQMPSAELSRGRGGPRCMSMPLWRELL